MTRAERFHKRVQDAFARCPRVNFGDPRGQVRISADETGYLLIAQGRNEVFINPDRVPAIVKFLRENFVRRDK